MQYYFENVSGLGNVAVSRHAQNNIQDAGITEHDFKLALLEPIKPDIPDGFNVVWRERGGIRLVIVLRPEPFKGAKLIVTVFRLKEVESVRF